MTAYDKINQVCTRYLAGNTPEDVADNTLAGLMQQLRDFVHSVGNDLTVLAGGGQASQVGVIRSKLTATAGVGRQDALRGDDATANESKNSINHALINFSPTFIQTCWDQTFDPGLAIEISNQNDALGTGIDLTPCAQRRFSAIVPANYIFESCSLGVLGDWRISWDFGYLGIGKTTMSFPPLQLLRKTAITAT